MAPRGYTRGTRIAAVKFVARFAAVPVVQVALRLTISKLVQVPVYLYIYHHRMRQNIYTTVYTKRARTYVYCHVYTRTLYD